MVSVTIFPRDQVALAPGILAPSAPSRQYSLPPDTAAFTGRHEEVHYITAALTGAASTGGVVAIQAIDGMPGVGKTALAVHAAHLVADQFPDRQLFVDLHGHTPGQQPTAPAVALAGLLAADGVNPRYLPADVDSRTAMWRSRMAGKRVLLILDNAVSSYQVAPLLPGTAGCSVLVTSRVYLGDLPAAVVEIPLDTLPPSDAQEMFVRLAPRAADEPNKVADLVGLCGYLPLAISLLARVLTRHPSWDIGDLIDETQTRLLTVTAEDRNVAAAFELSYRSLSPDQQRFFRYLGLHPGIDTDSYAAAALTGLTPAQAARHLEGLDSDRLITEHFRGRYRMHDLIRQYAHGLADDEPSGDRHQAVLRLLDYYQCTAEAADIHLARSPRPTSGTAISRPAAAPGMLNRTEAQAWMTAERANLLVCIDYSARRNEHSRVVTLTAAMAALLRRDGPWAEAIVRHTTAVKASHDIGDSLGQANALINLGDVRRLTGDYPAAASALEQALSIYRDLGNPLGQANALTNLGAVLSRGGDYPAAASALEQALSIYRDLGNPLGQANALTNLGDVRRLTGDYPAAASALERALSIYRDLGNRGGEATLLNDMGTLHRVSGDLDRAEACHKQALELALGIASSWDRAYSLAGLGRCALAAGDTADAKIRLRQAQEIFQQIGAADAIGVSAELALPPGEEPSA